MEAPPFSLYLVPVGEEDTTVMEHLAKELEVLNVKMVMEEHKDLRVGEYVQKELF